MGSKLYLFLQKPNKFKKKLKKNNLPEQIVDKMMENDLFSQWLGISIDAVSEGYCRISMTIRPEMLNGFGIAHGGIAFSLADSALAFASNSKNRKSLVLDASISFVAPVKSGDRITAIAEESNLTKRTGIYHVTLTNQDSKKVALFKGIVFRKDDQWFTDAE
jgi:acyl-CoA thioesterase